MSDPNAPAPAPPRARDHLRVVPGPATPPAPPAPAPIPDVERAPEPADPGLQPTPEPVEEPDHEGPSTPPEPQQPEPLGPRAGSKEPHDWVLHAARDLATDEKWGVDHPPLPPEPNGPTTWSPEGTTGKQPVRAGGKSPVKWVPTGGGWSSVVQHPPLGPGPWVAAGALTGLRAFLLVATAAVIGGAGVAMGSSWWSPAAQFLGFALATLLAVILGVLGWRYGGRRYVDRVWDGSYYLGRAPSGTVGAGIGLLPLGLWLTTLGPRGAAAGGAVLVGSWALLGVRVWAATSIAAQRMRARERAAEEWLSGGPVEDPHRALRARWDDRLGGEACKGPLVGSAVSSPVEDLPGGGWRAPIRLPENLRGGWEELAKDRHRIARAFGTDPSLVFPGPSRYGSSHAMLTVHKRDPLQHPVAWRGPSLKGGRFVIARLADSTDAQWPLWRGEIGVPSGVIGGASGGGKGGVVTLLHFEVGLSRSAVGVFMDPDNGASAPALTRSRVDVWVGDKWECVRHLAAMVNVMDARYANGLANRAPSRDVPALIASLSEFHEFPDLLIDPAAIGCRVDADVPRIKSTDEHGRPVLRVKVKDALISPIVRRGRKVGVGLYADTQHLNVDELGGSSIRAQFGNVAALLMRDKYQQQNAGTLLGFDQPPIPRDQPGAGAFAAADGKTPPIRGRALYVDAAAERIYDARRAENRHAARLDPVSRVAWETALAQETPS